MPGSERLDDLQLKGLRLYQDPSLFCFGIDAVLLSDFARVRPGERVLDLCSGNGILPVLLSGKTQAARLTGLEIFPRNVELARRSAAYNDLGERVDFIEGDVRDYKALIKEAGYDVVTCNPPYVKELPPGRGLALAGEEKDIAAAGKGTGLEGESDMRLAARHEVLCDLEDIALASKHALKSSGRLFLVHRPSRLAEIICVLSEHHLEPKRMRLVCPYAGKEPNLVLLEAVKGGRRGMVNEPPLIVYEQPGTYTREVLEIYGAQGE